MAAVNPPYVCQGRTDHPAQLFRLALAGVAGAPYAAGATSPQGGVDPAMGSAMLISGLASMNVQVGTGLVHIPNTSAWGGMYTGYNTATFNVAIAAASGTQWRRDYIVAQCTDPGDNTANWNVVAVTGTFSSSQPGALPTIPSNAIPLAIVNVVPNMTVTNGGGTVTDARVFNTLRGPWLTTSSARPSLSCPNGTMWYETDTNLVGIIVNGAYQYLPFSSFSGALQLQAIKLANTSRTTSTASIDPDLQIQLLANARYAIRLNLYWQTAGTGTLFKWTAFTEPAGASIAIYNAWYYNSAGTFIIESDFWNDVSHSSAAPNTGINYPIVIMGNIATGSSGGTFGLNWAGTNATSTVTLSANSHIIAERIG